ncbi:hypothetical protein [uncultured Dokdonia sp.]|uniref:hypothetical protein n=1 Tax=Dokdonia sp. R78006 TaxID=3093866 RepID=UPI0026288509|nr:hypothetical protein [uncultured Dokdonia sp.]
MNYLNLTKNQLLTEIDNKSKALINMGKQLAAISSKVEAFDIFLIVALNRTVNISKGYTTLMRENNFISAAPLIRINIDTLLRIYASIISEYDRNTYASKVMEGEQINKMKFNGTNQKLSDAFLYSELSKVQNMEWVSSIYKAGNSFIHLEKAHFYSSYQINKNENQNLNFSIGFHDNNIPDKEKLGSSIWMNKTVDSIIEQSQIWIYEKCRKYDYDINKLNNL